MVRKGTTLIEVLIAIFIMALGLVALLTLFPLGAAQMARSIQDERAAQLAANSAAYFRWYWKDFCENILPVTPGGQMMYQSAPGAQATWFTTAMDDPNAGIPPSMMKNVPNLFPPTPTNAGILATNVFANALNVRPSFPVMVDPIGWEAAAGTMAQYWVAPAGNGAARYAIPRRTMVGMSGNKAQAIRNFVLMDDMGFDADGTGIATERLGQYSCAWLIQREQNAKRSDVTLTVVVFFRRSTETPSEEPAFVGTGSGTILTINYNGSEKPSVRKGGWILDATMENAGSWVHTHARYYRVAEILEDNGSRVVVQLERDLKPLITNTPRSIVIQDRVLEVFEKGALDMSSPSRAN
jgi:type II secretory pathway pseudopilin PulG